MGNSGSGDWDWQPSSSYGNATVITLAGTAATISRTILNSTQIAFYEDDLRLKRVVGACRVSLAADMPPQSVNIALRLRLAMEDQVTGVITTAGAALDDPAVAEEHFLAEKRFRLFDSATTDRPSNRNDFVHSNPWYLNWDVPVARTFGIPRALVLTCAVTSGLAGDDITFVDYFRCLVRK